MNDLVKTDRDVPVLEAQVREFERCIGEFRRMTGNLHDRIAKIQDYRGIVPPEDLKKKSPEGGSIVDSIADCLGEFRLTNEHLGTAIDYLDRIV